MQLKEVVGKMLCTSSNVTTYFISWPAVSVCCALFFVCIFSKSASIGYGLASGRDGD